MFRMFFFFCSSSLFFPCFLCFSPFSRRFLVFSEGFPKFVRRSLKIVLEIFLKILLKNLLKVVLKILLKSALKPILKKFGKRLWKEKLRDPPEKTSDSF